MKCNCKGCLVFVLPPSVLKSITVVWNYRAGRKERHPPCAGVPEPGLFPRYKSAPPPQESDPAGTNEWTSLHRSHSLYSHTHTQTDTQGASIDMIQILHKQNIMPTNRHTSMDTNIKKTSIQHFKTDEKGRESNHSPRMRCSLLCVWKA